MKAWQSALAKHLSLYLEAFFLVELCLAVGINLHLMGEIPHLVEVVGTPSEVEQSGEGVTFSLSDYPDQHFVTLRLRTVDRDILYAKRNSVYLTAKVDEKALVEEPSVTVYGLAGLETTYLETVDVENIGLKERIFRWFVLIFAGLVLLRSMYKIFQTRKEEEEKENSSDDWDSATLFALQKPELMLGICFTLLSFVGLGGGFFLYSSAISVLGFVVSVAWVRKFGLKGQWATDLRDHSANRELKLSKKIKTEKPKEMKAIKMLLDSPDGVDSTNKEGQTALHMAAASGNTEAIDLLLRHGATINFRDDEGQTPLTFAVLSEKCPAPAIAKLIERGADVAAIDSSEQSALDYAQSESTRSTAAAMLKRALGQTPAIITAAGGGKLADVSRLLAAGADPNLADYQTRDTPLMKAVRADSVGVATLLLRKGVDVLLTNEEGETAYSIAEAENRDSLLVLLKNPPPLESDEEDEDEEADSDSAEAV